jgi:zinc protease
MMSHTTTTRTTRFLLAMIAVLAGCSASSLGQAIPAHPEQIVFEPLEFTPPAATEFRYTLASGVPVYLSPSTEFPLVTITMSFRGGAYLEPEGLSGLASMTGQMMRQGGAGNLGPSELDEQLDFLAAEVGIAVGATRSTVTIDALKSNLGESFDLVLEMLRNPRFDAERMTVLRGQTLEDLRQRNDDGIGILLREWNALYYGRDHFDGRQPTGASVEAITVSDMQAFRERIFHPGNLIIAASGDFDTNEMLSFLDEHLAGWARGEAVPPPPAPTAQLQPGLYFYEKDQPQGQVVVGMPGIERDNPDAVPLRVMNDILGGSGFTSRILNRVRTDEGLAYTAGSAFRARVEYPGDFIAYYFSNAPTTALALKTVQNEIVRIRDEQVTTDELETIKQNIIEGFPQLFQSKMGTLQTFVDDEWTGRPADHWRTYRDRVQAVSPEDVQRVAREHLDPRNASVLIVGPWDAISAGNVASEDDPARRVTPGDLFPPDRIRALPQRDALSLEPVTKAGG